MMLWQKLKALLKDNNMTQEDLTERLDVSRQAVGKWVNDKGIPEVGKLVQISRLFGVSTDYLLKEECEEKSTLMKRRQKKMMHLKVDFMSAKTYNITVIGGRTIRLLY